MMKLLDLWIAFHWRVPKLLSPALLPSTRRRRHPTPISIDRGGHGTRNCDYVGQLPGENNWAITSHLSCTDISRSSRGGRTGNGKIHGHHRTMTTTTEGSSADNELQMLDFSVALYCFPWRGYRKLLLLLNRQDRRSVANDYSHFIDYKHVRKQYPPESTCCSQGAGLSFNGQENGHQRHDLHI